ncbi:MAG: DUF202 domain-containing protein [Caulobacter sp.]|nr:DUF202 domain-containing protein [Caulobacter sp.]
MSSQPPSKPKVDPLPPRPERMPLPAVPPLPEVDKSPDIASVQYSTHRTKLSTFRTQMSEHRTDLSEFRTDLSSHRTGLSEYRTDLSAYRTSLSTDRTDMSKRRTGMSFQRTRMSADRTLMSVIRTALSLIGFGFTIYQAFQKLHESGTIQHAAAPRNFGVALVALGILSLLVGIAHHVQFMLELRHTRDEMIHENLIHGQSRFPASFTLLVALALLLLGLGAVVSMVFNVAVFG